MLGKDANHEQANLLRFELWKSSPYGKKWIIGGMGFIDHGAALDNMSIPAVPSFSRGPFPGRKP